MPPQGFIGIKIDLKAVQTNLRRFIRALDVTLSDVRKQMGQINARTINRAFIRGVRLTLFPKIRKTRRSQAIVEGFQTTAEQKTTSKKVFKITHKFDRSNDKWIWTSPYTGEVYPVHRRKVFNSLDTGRRQFNIPKSMGHTGSPILVWNIGSFPWLYKRKLLKVPKPGNENPIYHDGLHFVDAGIAEMEEYVEDQISKVKDIIKRNRP